MWVPAFCVVEKRLIAAKCYYALAVGACMQCTRVAIELFCCFELFDKSPGETLQNSLRRQAETEVFLCQLEALGRAQSHCECTCAYEAECR